MEQKELEYWLKLSLIPGLGPVRISQLLDYFSTPKRILSATFNELLAVPNFGKSTAEVILKEGEKIDASGQLKRLRSMGVDVITFTEERYPKNLREIYDPPPLLYVKGELHPEDNLAVAIVGTRHSTAYGNRVAHHFAKELSSRGITVVSGLARGIDSWAHRGAIEGGGRTIAVLGTGIDICYPGENRKLFDEIAKQGAVVSEFPLSTGPERMNFPRRNRCISGLVMGVIVVEAPAKSGALITAGFALEQGRDVFAVPGNIFHGQSRGTHALIQEGAKLVHQPEDVWEEFNMFREGSPALRPPQTQRTVLNEEEKAVYHCLSDDPVHIDTLCQKTHLPANRLVRIMFDLEMKGIAVQIGQKLFVRGTEVGQKN